MAGEGPADAEELDRPLRRPADPLGDRRRQRRPDETELTVYTTRPDTLFGASFLAIAADHPLAKDAAAKNAEIDAFCEECRRAGTSLAALETAEKKGIDTGIRVHASASIRAGSCRSTSPTSC